MNDINEAIKTWRKVLNTITKIPMNMILSGESIRTPELVTIKNGQKVPIGYDEDCIVHYVDPTDDLSMVDTSKELSTIQSYELHLVVYGNNCKKVAQKIKSNIYTREVLDMLTENGIGILEIKPVENTSDLMTDNTYVLRYDLRIVFDCQFEDDRAIESTSLEEMDTDIVKD
jgi:hypothetical protein